MGIREIERSAVHVEEVGLSVFVGDHPNLCYPYLPHCR